MNKKIDTRPGARIRLAAMAKDNITRLAVSLQPADIERLNKLKAKLEAETGNPLSLAFVIRMAVRNLALQEQV